MTDVPLVPPRQTIEAQWRASDPRASAWVRANAGAGKTYVLAQRVLRLLLAGTEPSRLLCITYTKAAASEMANRVFDWLAGWVGADDEALAAAIEAIQGSRPSPETLVRARRLFAAAVETPGGLKIQTIHAFCERLLQQFPFEASVTAGFAVLEERAAAELLAEAQSAVLSAAADDPRLGAALPDLVVRLGDGAISGLLGDVLVRRGAMLDWVRETGDLEAALAALRDSFGLAPGEDEAGIVGQILAGLNLPRSEWASVADRMRQGSANDRKAGDRLAAAAAQAGEAALEDYLAVFLTADGNLRKAVVTKGLASSEPTLAARLEAERDRLAPLYAKLAAARLLTMNRALFIVADAVIQRYQALKGLRGLVDFDDLVERTAMLLTRTDAGWVLYKLDGGIDHILVDEAQDTSPRQWEIVEKMAGEFFAGEGARAAERSIFAVGDVKQSIYSFQGAEPARFAEMRRRFERAATGAGREFRSVPLQLSFRSTPAVLKAVDVVFADGPATAGIVTADDGAAVVHEAVRADQPGLVELWPVEGPSAVAEVAPWDAPLDARRADSPAVRLAERIAGTIRRWIDGGERLEATGEPIRPGDVMILLARRKPFAEPMIRALKSRGIPVAGADRMVLTEHIAVMDLMAAGRFALMPEDDLNLAALMKSPLLGITEEALLDLAAPRRGSLWAALAAAGREAPLAGIRERLEDWRRRAGFQRPYEFYAGILGAGRGRERFHARLGAEAFEAVDEFLALALAYERAETPSLPGFLAWLDAAPTQIKRDMDKGRDEVRVMTVHGAKGLEAPVVFLPDCARTTGGRGVGPLFRFEDGRGAPLVWAPSKAEDCGPTALLRAEAERRRDEESNRLLYVAMTRARDRLYVAGFRTSDRATSAPTWHDLIGAALEPLLQDVETPDGPVRRYAGAGRPAGAKPSADAGAPPPLPDWLRRDVGREHAAPAPLAPSSLAEHGPLATSAGADRSEALRRGTIMHRLMESLPDVAPGDRRAAAGRALAVLAPDWPDSARVAAAAEVLAVLDDPVFAAVFAPGGRAEVGIAGPAGPDGAMLIGQIDRLWVGEAEVLIVDFKTDRAVPGDPAEVPEAYRAQMAAYRALGETLWPGKRVRTALLWTAAPRLMEIA